MAADLFPYSQRNGGQVSDGEHELLWSGEIDGILPGQAATALQPAINSATGAWTVQPGLALVNGHVFNQNTIASGTLATTVSSPRTDLLVARIDKTVSPWTYAVTVHQGVPGAGTPTLSRDTNGLYEFLLAIVVRNPNGTASMTADTRVWQSGGGSACLSTQRPHGVAQGTLAYEKDTGRLVVWNGTGWDVVSEDGGWTNINAAGSWGVNGLCQGIRRNGWIYLRFGVKRQDSDLVPGHFGTDSGSPVLGPVPTSLRPHTDHYDVFWSDTHNILGRMTMHADDGRLYITQMSGTIKVGDVLFNSLSYPGD